MRCCSQEDSDQFLLTLSVFENPGLTPCMLTFDGQEVSIGVLLQDLDGFLGHCRQRRIVGIVGQVGVVHVAVLEQTCEDGSDGRTVIRRKGTFIYTPI